MQLERGLVGAGDQKQIGRERREPVGLLGGRAQRILELGARARMAQRELELRAQQGERSSELVARLGDEPALMLEGRLQPAEHLVQRLGEP